MAVTSIRSIFGECTGNVRSTPTPNDCLRTVNVSRTPAPCRLITIPSKTCTLRRWPSITWKWTRTESPALNGGRFVRSWRCSRLSMTRFMKRGPAGRRRMLAQQAQPRSAGEDGVERDPVRRPVRGEDLPDQVPARNRPPTARVAGLRTVVAHEEVLALRHVPVAGLVVAAAGPDVGLVQLLSVDGD